MEFVCRFRAARIAGEAALALASCTFAGLGWVWNVRPELTDSPACLIPPAGLLAAVLGLLVWRRWRSRYVIDDRGVEWRRSASRVVTRLGWTEVEEIFLLGWSEFELRGAGRSIRFDGAYDEIPGARELCLPRIAGIRDHLRARALREGRLVFRMPGMVRAHLAYLGAVLVLTTITALSVWPVLMRGTLGFPVVLVVVGGSWLWGLRRRASGLGTRVTLQREGILVRRLDRSDRVPWPELDRVEWNDRGGLDLVLRRLKVIPLPAALGNLALLEEFLRQWPAADDSGSLGGASDRTMLQSS